MNLTWPAIAAYSERALSQNRRRLVRVNSSKKQIPTLVKDASLVAKRRRQIADASVRLFVQKGYHETTTREIGREAGLSIGALYEYIQSKEDVLYLVCDAIHSEMEARLREALPENGMGRERLGEAIRRYITTCDKMQDWILLVYQESNSLAPESLKYVLQNEARITELFRELLKQGIRDGSLGLRGDKATMVMAHNIIVLGHMWAFRRWFLHRKYKLREFIDLQVSLILNELSPRGSNGEANKKRRSQS